MGTLLEVGEDSEGDSDDEGWASQEDEEESLNTSGGLTIYKLF